MDPFAPSSSSIQPAPTHSCPHRLLQALLVVLWVTSALGCALYSGPHSTPAQTTDTYELRIVESDDFGTLWDRDAAQKTLDEIRHLSQNTNTLVIVYIHGWHHNAAADDTNLEDFKRWLPVLHGALNTPARRELRQRLTNTPDFRIVGLYLGWRGQSLPWYADYLTFWGRKNAAERVGSGDLAEFISRLQSIFVEANARNGDANPRSPFTGLVTFGHSFGAQVLWKAIQRQLEEDLSRQAPQLSAALSPYSVPAPAEAKPISGFGDLNVLVNPAVESYQFARIDALYRQLAYTPAQSPQLIVFSADNDYARKIWFPIGRAATGPFRPSFRLEPNDYQGTLWGKALGNVPEQRTHSLEPAPDGAFDSLTEADYVPGEKICSYDFTSPTTFSSVILKPLPAEQSGSWGGVAPRTPHSPVMVVETRQKIIDGHNDAFGPRFLSFLWKYVAFIEGKRLLQRKQKHVAGTDQTSLSRLCRP